jgi:hypothetical protein
LVVVDRGFNREVFAGIESDSLSVDGDRAEQKNMNKEKKKFGNLKT